MKVLKNSISFFLLLLLCSSNIFATTQLIKEVEDLRNSISLTDRQRPRLTLRLADLYFDLAQEMIQKEAESGQLEISTDSKKNLDKSLSLYELSLNGEKGKFPEPSYVNKFKIYFQEARIYQKLKKFAQATKYFELVLNYDIDSVNIKREAVLNLGEIYENNNNLKKSLVSYEKALSLCDKKELCSYIQYRKSWIFYKMGEMDKAVETIKLGLYDSSGNLKQQSLQDYLMFLSQRATNGEKELIEIEAFGIKHKRPEVVTSLMEGYFGEGNRLAGVHFLSYLNQRTPRLDYQVRLLEEYYGFRDWEFFSNTLSQVSEHKKELSDKTDENEKIKKILQRLIVQLDSERVHKADLGKELQQSIDAYLSFFPNDELRDKMVNGWIVAEKDETKILAKLEHWISQEKQFNRFEREKFLRIKRISLAQKLKESQVVISEASELIPLLDAKDKREYEYLVARTQYEIKDYVNALIGFKKLADIGKVQELGKIDKWSLMSQNLALDILNQQKQYTQLKNQSLPWLSYPEFKTHKEYKDMIKIHEQAKFQEAFTMQESIESLAVFRDYCLNDKFKEKSCENAKILAIKLKQQSILIDILKKLKDEETLLVEYEAMGEFSKAAQILEKMHKKVKKFDLDAYLKIALFYEIDKNLEQRDRILRYVISKLKTERTFDEPHQVLVYKTLNDAGMLDVKIVGLPWSTTRKMQLIHELELRGTGNKVTHNLLMKSKTSLGDKWSLGILKRVYAHYEQQKKISFYGRRSQQKFKKRLSKLKVLADLGKSYLDGADLKTRVLILNLISQAYNEMYTEILNTPIPRGLEEDQIQQVKISLQDMAAPFKLEYDNYFQASEEQRNQIADLEMKEKLVNRFDNFTELFGQEPIWGANIKELNYQSIDTKFAQLKNEPNSTDALETIKNYFELNKQDRIANYFKGRILSL